jgi:predicted aspartyl protease
LKLYSNLLIKLPMLLVLALSAAAAFGGLQNKTIPPVPFDLTNNLIFLQARINSSKSLPFILDTGASVSVINESWAKELGIPGVELPDTTLAAIRLSGLEAGLGQPVGGILGYDIFERYIVEIDYASRLVRLYGVESYKYSGKGQALPITIEERTPFIRARILKPYGGSAEGKFEFDTGQTGALTLTGSFVTQNKLLAPSQRTLQITTGAILAGQVNARVSRVRGLQLGHFVIANPTTNITQGAQDTGLSTEKAGLIGGEILRRFKVIVDYKRERVILEASNRLASPFEFDMSGMSLAAPGPDFRTYRVRTLVEGSPAAEAGVKVGDIITAISSRPAAEMTLSQIRQMLREARTEYVLSIKRGDDLMQIKIKTRKLI